MAIYKYISRSILIHVLFQTSSQSVNEYIRLSEAPPQIGTHLALYPHGVILIFCVAYAIPTDYSKILWDRSSLGSFADES